MQRADHLVAQVSGVLEVPGVVAVLPAPHLLDERGLGWFWIHPLGNEDDDRAHVASFAVLLVRRRQS